MTIFVSILSLVVLICSIYIIFWFGRTSYRTNKILVTKVGDVETNESAVDDSSDNNSANTTSATATAKTGNNNSWLISLLLAIIIGGGSWWGFQKATTLQLSPEEIATQKEEQKLLAQGWQKARVVIIHGPKNEPVVKVHLPGTEKKTVQFKNYRWTKSYLKDSTGIKVFSIYPTEKDSTLMGENPIALMSGPKPPPDIIWWSLIE